MALRYYKSVIGTYTYHSNNKNYAIEMRMGNCDSVHIWIDKEKDEAHLFNFVADTEHLKNIERNKQDLFKNCTQIRLNAWHKPNIRLMKHAVKNGHLVTMYYDNLNKEFIKDKAIKHTCILTKEEITMMKQIMFQTSTDKKTTKEIRDFARRIHKEFYNIYTKGVAIQFNRYKGRGK